MGEIYEKMNDNNKAIEFYIKSIDIYSNLSDKDPKSLAEEYQRLSHLLKSEGRLDESKEYQQKANALLKGNKGEGKKEPQHKQIYDKALSLIQEGKYKEALAELKKGTESINKKSEKKDDLSFLAKFYDTQGNIYFRQEKFQEARESFEKAYNSLKKVHGENSFEVAGIYNNIAGALLSEGKINKALETAQKALKIAKGKEDNVSTTTTYMNLGRISVELEDYENALSYFEQAYNLRKKLLGEDHPETLVANGAYRELLTALKEEKN